MKNFYFKRTGILAAFLFLCSAVGFSQTHITDAAGLDGMRNDGAASYILDNDIDMAGVTWEPFDFTGTLDGNDFAIKNLEIIKGQGEAGLFYYINGGTVKNLSLIDAYIECSGTGGALAKVIENATIEKCFVSGEVKTGGLAGGFIGEAKSSTITNCIGMADVTGHDHVGGVIGHMSASVVENCYVDADVYSDGWQVGGIVGWAMDAGAKITKCVANGTVKSEGGFTGGILGIADGGEKVVDITECLALLTKIETVNPDIEKTYRIIANHAAGTYSKNYALSTTVISDPHKLEWENDVNGKDGASITMEDQVLVAQFYSDSLTWDFTTVWELTSVGPKLQWDSSIGVGVAKEMKVSDAKVYSKFGSICIEGAQLNSTIRVYSITGALQLETVVSSSTELVDVKGLSIVVIESQNQRNAFKVLNF